MTSVLLNFKGIRPGDDGKEGKPYNLQGDLIWGQHTSRYYTTLEEAG